MKKSPLKDSQIIAVLKAAERGTLVTELCRTHGISSATFYKWKAKFGGMAASLMARMKKTGSRNYSTQEVVRQRASQRGPPPGRARKKC